MTTAQASFKLIIVPLPCQRLSVPQQSDPPAYAYSGDSPKLVFEPRQVSISPASCPLYFECQIVSGPRTDLCSVSEGASIGEFDETSGIFTF